MYGAYKYARGQMHQLRPGAAVAEAGPMTPDVLASPADGATRRVGPFEMKPAVALKCAGGVACELLRALTLPVSFGAVPVAACAHCSCGAAALPVPLSTALQAPVQRPQ